MPDTDAVKAQMDRIGVTRGPGMVGIVSVFDEEGRDPNKCERTSPAVRRPGRACVAPTAVSDANCIFRYLIILSDPDTSRKLLLYL